MPMFVQSSCNVELSVDCDRDVFEVNSDPSLGLSSTDLLDSTVIVY